MYGRDSVCISIHILKGMPYKAFFKNCEKIFLKYGGRPHWGKIHYLTAHQLKQLYPKWALFQQIRKELDPGGIFMSPYLKSLFID